jgi:hypothetical protein
MQVIRRIGVGVAREHGAAMLADDREGLARFVIGGALRDPVGIAGLGPPIVAII